MTVSVLQTVYGTDSATTGLTEAVTLTVTAGSSIHVGATIDSLTTFASIASVPVMTWTLRDDVNDTGNNQRMAHWTADGAASGSLVITVTNTILTDFRGCWASEIGGTSGYDAAASAAHAAQFQATPGTGTDAVTSGNTSALSTQPACVSAFCLNAAANATPSVGTGFTGTGSGFAVGGGTNFVTAEYKRVTATAAVASTFTTTSNSGHLTVVAVFKESGAVGINATFGVTESSDTIVSGLTHGANATLTVTESGDTIVAGATQTTTGIGATLTITEASDTVVAGLTHGANFSLTVTEASDTAVSGLTHGANATFTVTEAADTIAAGATLVSLTNATFNVTEASDTIVSSLTAGENFTLTVTEASDSVVAGLTAGENASLNVTEASDTIVAGATTLLAGINATFTVTEANDTVVAGLSASVTGNVNVTEGSDTCFGQLDTGNPAVVVTTAGAGSGGARKKRLYILPDGTRIYATPSEIAQILKLFYQKKPEEKLTKKQKKFADVVFTQDFEPTEKVVPKVYELKPQYKRVQQLDYVAFLETLRKRDEEEFMMMMEVF